jgi:hypothetical protein
VNQDLVEVDLRVVAVVDSSSFGDHAFLTRGRGKIGCRRLCSRWNGRLLHVSYRRGSGLSNWLGNGLGDRLRGLDRYLLDGLLDRLLDRLRGLDRYLLDGLLDRLLDRLRDGFGNGLCDRRGSHRGSLTGLGRLGYCPHGWLRRGRLLHGDYRGSGLQRGRLPDRLRDGLLGGRRWRRFSLGHGDERDFFLRQRHGEPPRWWSRLGRL